MLDSQKMLFLLFKIKNLSLKHLKQRRFYPSLLGCVRGSFWYKFFISSRGSFILVLDQLKTAEMTQFWGIILISQFAK